MRSEGAIKLQVQKKKNLYATKIFLWANKHVSCYMTLPCLNLMQVSSPSNTDSWLRELLKKSQKKLHNLSLLGKTSKLKKSLENY